MAFQFWRKVVLVFIVFIWSSIMYAQDCAQLSVDYKDGLSLRSQDRFVFVFPDYVSEEEITSSAVFYANYFSVDYNAATKEVLVAMLKNDDKSRHIIVRFLTACGIDKVKVSGVNYSLEEFFNRCLRN